MRTRGSSGLGPSLCCFSWWGTWVEDALLAMPLVTPPGVWGPLQGEQCEVDQTCLSEPQPSFPPA